MKCNSGEEQVAAGLLLSQLISRARDAGGEPPAPARPNTVHLQDLQNLVGNEQLVGLHNERERLASEAKEWLETQTTIHDLSGTLEDYEFDYLRFIEDDGTWKPASGTFDGWPSKAAELKILDPCCGSGHFLVAVFELMARNARSGKGDTLLVEQPEGDAGRMDRRRMGSVCRAMPQGIRIRPGDGR